MKATVEHEAELVKQVRDYQRTLRPKYRLELWAAIMEGYCRQCGGDTILCTWPTLPDIQPITTWLLDPQQLSSPVATGGT